MTDETTNFTVNCIQCLRSDKDIFPIAAINPDLPLEVSTLLNRYSSVTQPFETGKIAGHKTRHHIETQGPPLCCKPRPIHGEKLRAAKKEFDTLLELGIVRHSNSPWSSPIHLVPKGDSWRVCGDYRRVNNVTERDSYPMTNVNSLNCLLHGKKLFSKIDLVRGYNQIPMDEDSIEKTAVNTPFGLFEYTRMPFGLCNASRTFQRFMNELLGHLDFVFAYIDDVLIFSESAEEHMAHLEIVLKIMSENGLHIGVEKCSFLQTEINFLGHHISQSGICPCPKKTETISMCQVPSNLQELQSFLGSMNFYRNNIPHFAEKAQRLYDLIKTAPHKKAKIEFSDEDIYAFEALKLSLQEVVEHSFIDPSSNTFTITTDASKRAIGGVLHQIVNGEPKTIQFYSRKLQPAEERYSTFDRELLAAHNATEHFKPYIDGQIVTLFTDHKPLVMAFVKKTDCKSDRQARHLSFLSEYVNDLQFISGQDNILADFLSRPVNNVQVETFDLAKMAQLQANDAEIQEMLNSKQNIQSCNDGNIQLLCETSNGVPRPIVPKEMRLAVFNNLHNIGHPGVKSGTRLIRERFFWPMMSKDIKEWTRTCQTCQQEKVCKHTKKPWTAFPTPSQRFSTVHMDIIELPVAVDFNGGHSPYRYVVTFIDRFTRWVEAEPLSGISAEEVAGAFINTWISRFGVPLEVVTDRGRQFESALFKSLSSTLGFSKLRTTAYHPQCNGLIERQHRTLKTILRAHKESWLKMLPVALFAMRITPSSSTDLAPFTMVTGAIPFVPTALLNRPRNQQEACEFTRNLVTHMQSLEFSPTQWKTANTSFVPKELNDCSKVWVRVDRHRRSLESPYAGPYPVLQRHPDYFTIELPNGNQDTVSLNRLKPFNEKNVISANQPEVRRKQLQKIPKQLQKIVEQATDAFSDDDNPDDFGELSNHEKFAKKIPFKTRSGRTVTFAKKNSVRYY